MGRWLRSNSLWKGGISCRTSSSILCTANPELEAIRQRRMQELMARQVWGINRTLNNRKLRKMPRGIQIAVCYRNSGHYIAVAAPSETAIAENSGVKRIHSDSGGSRPQFNG
ncbi:hypothetical protein GOBAR_AA12290 [Gossypium barbadense]|uniref:Uncharacterized protein n=1 Tax=Gossypium barbadense TaxID=3634 RepID=A0A2P5XYH1_GOSBA|nr:hypothetical protein GOBAR_AA12290 [Gossypium barbadense]